MTLNTNSLIEIEVHMTGFNQTFMNVFQYRFSEFEFGVTLEQILPAYWNHVKGVYRALAAVAYGTPFQKLVGRELNNPVGELAEYGIPEGEQAGTRPNPSPTDALPPFNTAGVRLLVSTRATRPGQKRLPFLYEADNLNGNLTGAFTALLVNWANTMTDTMTLGAPAALTALEPIVCRKTPQGLVVAEQNVTGYLINPAITTQNSRKIGRGI